MKTLSPLTQNLFHPIMVGAGSFIDNDQAQSPKHTISRSVKFMYRFLSLIEQRIDDPELSLDKVARLLHISTMQLYRKVKRYAGKSPNQFIRTFRLNRSCDLLLSTDWNIAEVAYSVGFNDPNYFTRSFTQEYHISPSRYRTQNFQSKAVPV